jgi:5-carboxymethyl-2-hydroxymuconate isomerase
MPHLVILYTANLENETNMTTLCRDLADVMLAQKDDTGEQVFPTGGTRVLAYPAPHHAVADGKRDYAFVYLNLRMGYGRSDAIKERAGDALLAKTKTHFETLFAKRHLGITLQIDEGAEVYNAKHSNLHPLFQ